MLRDLGVDWELLENKISIGIEDELFSVESMDSLKKISRNMLGKLYPESLGDISLEKIISAIQELSQYTRILYEFDNPNFGNVMSDRKFIFRELFSGHLTSPQGIRRMNKYKMPMEIFLEGLNRQPVIK